MTFAKLLSLDSRKRNAVKRPDHSMLNPVTALRSVPGCHRKNAGLTLVELLVTVTIMGMVVAISVPIIKPMLASNKVKSGADIVAGFLAQARNRAVEENRPVGVTFERVLNYEDNGAYPYNGACVVMRQVAEPRPLSGFVKDVRVAVDASGQINFCTWNNTTVRWDWGTTNTEQQYWDKLVGDSDQIQFDGKGPKYTIKKSGSNFAIDMTDDANINLPAPLHFDANNLPQPVLFKIFRKPQANKIAPTMAMPAALPSGVVVDLDCSGMGLNFFDAKRLTENNGGTDWTSVGDDFCAVDQTDRSSVTIMFSPTGEVDRVYCNNKQVGPTPSDMFYGKSGVIPTRSIFLNIGIWERAGFWDNTGGWHVSNDYLPNDGVRDLRNYRDMNNYWVTIFPRTGAVRVNRVASVPSGSSSHPGVINESRNHAESLHSTETK